MNDPDTLYQGLHRTNSVATTRTSMTTSSTSSSRTIRPNASTSFIPDATQLQFARGAPYGFLPPDHPYMSAGVPPIPPARSSSLSLAANNRFMPYQAVQAESSAMGANQGGMMMPMGLVQQRFHQYHQQHQQQQQQQPPQQQQQPQVQAMWPQTTAFGFNPVYQMPTPEHAISSSSSISLQPAAMFNPGSERRVASESRVKSRARRHTDGQAALKHDPEVLEAKKLRTREKGRERQRRKRERDRQARDGIKPSGSTSTDATNPTPTLSLAIPSDQSSESAYDPSASEPSSASSSVSGFPTTGNNDLSIYSPTLSYSTASASEQSSPSVFLSRSLPPDASFDLAAAFDANNPGGFGTSRQASGSRSSHGDFRQLLPNTLSPTRDQRRQSEPRIHGELQSPQGSHSLRAATSTNNLQAPSLHQRMPSEGSVVSVSGTDNAQSSVSPIGRSDAGQFFASMLIYGVTSTNLSQTLEEAVGIGPNELEEMRGALASVFEQYGVASRLRNVTIQEESTSESTGGSTSAPNHAATFSTSSASTQNQSGAGAFSFGANQGAIDQSQDFNRPVSSHSSTSSHHSFATDGSGVNPIMISPGLSSPGALGTDGWTFSNVNFPAPSQQQQQQQLSQLGSPNRLNASGSQVDNLSAPTGSTAGGSGPIQGWTDPQGQSNVFFQDNENGQQGFMY